MATTFHLPNTPPQGHTFPPNISATNVNEFKPANEAIISVAEVQDSPPQASRSFPPLPPSLGVETQAPRLTPRSVRTTSAENRLAAQTPAVGFPLPSTDSQTPVHRNMFPTYNPAAPVAQQVRSPPQSPLLPMQQLEGSYLPSLYSNACSPPMGSLSNMFAASHDNMSVSTLPTYDSVINHGPAVTLSEPEDLLDIYCIANGQESQEMAPSYNMGLVTPDLALNSELISLASTGGALYTLRATAGTLTITRTHPLNQDNIVSIATPSLYSVSARAPLLTSIFPILAKVRAVDQASSVAVTHNLSRQESASLEREAITRAHATIATPVLMNTENGTFYISMPVCNPETSHRDSLAPEHQLLPIEINPTSSIRIMTPGSSEPILTLSLPARTLIVHTFALLNLPSQYTIDILVTALLALALHLHRRSGLLSPESLQALRAAPSFDPPPRFPAATASRGSRRSSRAVSQSHSATRERSRSRLDGLLHPLAQVVSNVISPARSRSDSAAGQHASGGNYNHMDTLAIGRSATPDSGSGNGIPSGIRSQSRMANLANRSGLSIHSSTTRAAAHLGIDSCSLASPTATLHNSPPLNTANSYTSNPQYQFMPTTPKLEHGLSQPVSLQGTAPELRGDRTGLDLSRFQAYDLEDPRLGAGTRAMLRVVYWLFGCLVWILGVGVGCLAELIVVLGNGCGGRAAKGKK